MCTEQQRASRVDDEEQHVDFSGNVSQSVGLVETAQNVKVLAAKENTAAAGAHDRAELVQANHSGGTAPIGHNNATIETAAGELATAAEGLTISQSYDRLSTY